MSRIALALLVLLASFPSDARDYQLSATNADLPTCSSNNWQQGISGAYAHTTVLMALSLSPLEITSRLPHKRSYRRMRVLASRVAI